MLFAKNFKKTDVKRYIIQRNITDDGTAYDKPMLSCTVLFFGLLTNLTGAVFIEQGLFFCPKTSIIFEKYEKSHSALLAYTCAL